MASIELSQADPETLANLFDQGLELYNKINNSQEATNSPEFQQDVKAAMKLFEKSTQLVSLTDVFSKNEGVEEVSTNDLRFFLLPALLGSLSLKLTTGDRKDIVNCAEIYYKDFLNRTNDYGLSNYVFKDKVGKEVALKEEKNELEQIAAAVNTRANKIERFRQQKELQSKLQDLKKNLDNDHADEEVKRNYFLTMIKVAIHEGIEELSSIEMEKPILEHMSNLKPDDGAKPLKRPPPPLKPIIITRDEVQKAIYGTGYPALPTMTVQEFYDKRVADGVFPDPNKPPPARKPEEMSLMERAAAGLPAHDEDQEQADKDRLQDEDDEENLQRMRSMDEFKDDNRRGWGNRMNRS